MGTTIIFGSSKGLGADLVDHYKKVGQLVTVSRSNSTESNHISADVSTPEGLQYIYEEIEATQIDSFDLLIFCVSAWGESGKFATNEIEEFLNAGPLAFIRIVKNMYAKKQLTTNAAVIAIGSIATTKSEAININRNDPAYTASKSLQRTFSFELQRQLNSDDITITTLTVGGLGEGDSRLPHSDLIQLIDVIRNLSTHARPVEILLPSKSDFQ